MNPWIIKAFSAVIVAIALSSSLTNENNSVINLAIASGFVGVVVGTIT